jgi:hypothetical protein
LHRPESDVFDWVEKSLIVLGKGKTSNPVVPAELFELRKDYAKSMGNQQNSPRFTPTFGSGLWLKNGLQPVKCMIRFSPA